MLNGDFIFRLRCQVFKYLVLKGNLYFFRIENVYNFIYFIKLSFKITAFKIFDVNTISYFTIFCGGIQ